MDSVDSLALSLNQIDWEDCHEITGMISGDVVIKFINSLHSSFFDITKLECISVGNVGELGEYVIYIESRQTFPLYAYVLE